MLALLYCHDPIAMVVKGKELVKTLFIKFPKIHLSYQFIYRSNIVQQQTIVFNLGVIYLLYMYVCMYMCLC